MCQGRAGAPVGKPPGPRRDPGFLGGQQLGSKAQQALLPLYLPLVARGSELGLIEQMSINWGLTQEGWGVGFPAFCLHAGTVAVTVAENTSCFSLLPPFARLDFGLVGSNS